MHTFDTHLMCTKNCTEMRIAMGIIITHKQMEFWKRNITAVVGMLIFSMGINFFIVPADLYNGGVLGVS